jgi:NAD(P)-dependent dehydrogenase (short-subunit alcohol dehydrogenase family)
VVVSFEDRVVVVAGAAGRLGPVVARAFAHHGARIAALGRRREPLEETVASLRGGTDRHLVVECDLAVAESAATAPDAVRAGLGEPSVLLQLVGGYLGGTRLTEAPADEWPRMIDWNLWPTYHAIRAFLPSIREAEHGRIVAVSTPFAQNPSGGSAAYAASKAAVETLTLSVAKELAGTTATANVVLVRTIGDAKPTFTRPEEIAAAMLFLCSPEAGAINGQRIPLLGRG